MRVSRRDLLGGAGALLVGWQLDGADVPTGAVDSWVAIGADETVTAYSGKCDFGQGFRTVQHQLVAEELGVALGRVRMVICDTAVCPDQGVSSGSQGHRTQFGGRALRQALATAREALFRMAAGQLGVGVGELAVADGVVYVGADRARRVSYGKLIGGKKINLRIDPRAVPKDPATYTVLGKSAPRLDIPGKAAGSFEYIHNVRVPGMLHAKVVRPPAVGAHLVRVDESSVASLPGGVRVVVRKDFVAVAAASQWEALRAAEKLAVQWTAGDGLPAQATLYDAMRTMPSRGSYAVHATGVDEALAAAARKFQATYLHPFQMHGSLGPSCAVADVRDGKATVWSASQGVYPQRDTLALMLGMPAENIRSVYVEGSGCYGLNGADAVAIDAAVISHALGVPVRLQYTRKDEMAAGESFGPAYVIDLKAGVDTKGQMTAWEYEAWTFSKGSRPSPRALGNTISGGLLGYPAPAVTPTATPSEPRSYGNGSNVAPPYGAGCVGEECGGTGTVRAERVLVHTIPSPLYTGPLRSPNRLQNTFANECFVDEIAAALRVDPVEYRLRHLTDSRLADVLRAAAKGAAWESRPSPKPGNSKTGVVRGRGVAIVFYEGNNGYGGLVAEVEVDQRTGKVVVTRLVASNDSGPVSNPDGLRAQMEGGALQGMSRALYEEVHWDATRVTSTDWTKFPVFRFGERIPVVETVLVDRKDMPQMGAGETIITLSAAAIGNAIFDATGARVRRVPFTPANVLAAIASARVG